MHRKTYTGIMMEKQDTRHAVLSALEQNKGMPVSGNALAKQLSLSRTAVWKAVTGLKNEGYEIRSVPGHGYILSNRSDILSEEAIRAVLQHDVPLFLYDTLSSTNQTAASIAMENAPAGTTVIAREQTAGKGRRGRSFYSPKDTGLYLSIILRPEEALRKSILITAAVAVAVSSAIDEIAGVHTQIKWVNDIYLHGKKISGTLTEAITDIESGEIRHIITGIGINCNTTNFPDSAGAAAGSIGFPLSRNALAARIIDRVLEESAQLQNRAFLSEYRRRSMVLGKGIDVYPLLDAPPFPATAEDIDENGGLIIRCPDGHRETLSSGEITIRVKKGQT